MDAIFDGDYYSEREKVQIAARTFDDDAFEWWDELKAQRHFYGERPISTWHELKDWLRKRLRQNCEEELRAGMENIEFLFSQWKESSPNNNVTTPTAKDESLKTEHVKPLTTKDESLKTEHVEIKGLEDSLMENLESQEDEGAKTEKLGHDSLVEENEVPHQSEVVFIFPCNDVIPIVHTSQPNVLVFSKFIQLYHVCSRKENPLLRVEKESACDEIREIETMREKKKKKKRNGKRVKEKLFVLDYFPGTMARI